MSQVHGVSRGHHEVASEWIAEMPTVQITHSDYPAAKGKIKITFLI
jgi:hypothetical protein